MEMGGGLTDLPEPDVPQAASPLTDEDAPLSTVSVAIDKTPIIADAPQSISADLQLCKVLLWQRTMSYYLLVIQLHSTKAHSHPFPSFRSLSLSPSPGTRLRLVLVLIFQVMLLLRILLQCEGQANRRSSGFMIHGLNQIQIISVHDVSSMIHYMF
jgi:hypothetical protein